MEHFDERHIIEALRSGIPSRRVGRVFSEARPEIHQTILNLIDRTADEGTSSGIVISGKYGEGKTHLLHTVFDLAQKNNMVVSMISLSKETPMDKLPVIFRKIAANTFLPGREQPGFSPLYDKLTSGSAAYAELLMRAMKELETDKLCYVLQCLVKTDDADERFLLTSDLEGDLLSGAELKRLYKKLYQQTAKYAQPFSKTKHMQDYFSFLSMLFKEMGYRGWVLLFDEAELIGRMGKKARLKAYNNIHRFLFPAENLVSVLSVFALSSSFEEDVIEGKHEYENVKEVYSADLYPDEAAHIGAVLDRFLDAEQLRPLTGQEISDVLSHIRLYHEAAYGWTAPVSDDELVKISTLGGYLLRSRIRSAIEYLDQFYQYGAAPDLHAGSLTETDLAEEDVPSLEGVREIL